MSGLTIIGQWLMISFSRVAMVSNLTWLALLLYNPLKTHEGEHDGCLPPINKELQCVSFIQDATMFTSITQGAFSCHHRYNVFLYMQKWKSSKEIPNVLEDNILNNYGMKMLLMKFTFKTYWPSGFPNALWSRDFYSPSTNPLWFSLWSRDFMIMLLLTHCPHISLD